MLYVPKKNQHLIRTSLPTSHGYQPRPREGDKEIFNPLLIGAGTKSYFETLFGFVATLDISSYLCIAEALKFRREVCGGEDAVMKYCQNIAAEAAKMAIGVLKTEIMQNEEKTLTQCAMVNVRLPLTMGAGKGNIPEEDGYAVSVWMTSRMAEEHDLYSPVYPHAGHLWTRWSGQIYLDLDDYKKGAMALKSLCTRARQKEYLLKAHKL